jgi:CBS domain-containing protein
MATVESILGRKGRDVVCVAASESVLNAATIMNERGIGGVVVTDDGEMVGIFTERDVLRRVVAENRDPSETLIRDVMTSPVVSCRPDTPLEECSAAMTGRRVRHLPVLDESGLSGIVTSGDILAHQVEDQEATIQHLNSYIFNVR